MTNTVISKMVDGQEKGVKQVLQSPTRVKGKAFQPNNTKQPLQKYQKASYYRSPRSSPQHEFNSLHSFGENGNRSPQQKVGRSSPSRVNGGQRNARSPRLSPNHGELYAGFSDSPEPAALPQPPSHWIFPILLAAQA